MLVSFLMASPYHTAFRLDLPEGTIVVIVGECFLETVRPNSFHTSTSIFVLQNGSGDGPVFGGNRWGVGVRAESPQNATRAGPILWATYRYWGQVNL